MPTVSISIQYSIEKSSQSNWQEKEIKDIHNYVKW